MAHFAIYMNNPTAGSIDGTRISEGDQTLPLTATLDASQSETTIMKCAIRCDSGYVISSDTTISFSGDTASKWKVAEDNDYSDATIAAQMCTWQDEISIESVTAVNKVFWVKASSSPNETPSNDISVTIDAVGIVAQE